MNAIRFALTTLSLILLTAGYAASQWAFFWGDPASHSARMDQGPVRVLALVVLGAAIVFSFLPDRDSDRGAS
jgi:hypothetical protein